MEPTRLTVFAIMSPPRAAHLQAWADDPNEGPSCLGLNKNPAEGAATGIIRTTDS